MNKQGSIAEFESQADARAAGYTFGLTPKEAAALRPIPRTGRLAWKGEEITKRRAANKAARRAWKGEEITKRRAANKAARRARRQGRK